jgi:hypothetical protein
MHYKLATIQWAVSSSATTSTSITPTIPKIISSHGRRVGDEGNNTPFFFIPVFLVVACNTRIASRSLRTQVVACGVVLRARLFDREYHVVRDLGRSGLHGSDGNRAALRSSPAREQQFRVIHFFWDRIRYL